MISSIVKRRGTVIAALLLLVWPMVAGADVRRQEDAGGRPWLDVQLTQRGPWSPLAPVDANALNPWGDTVGDGQPGSADSEDRLFAAWLRPTESTLFHAESLTGSPWQVGRSISAPGAVGVPIPSVVGDGWGMAWQAVSPAGRPVIDVAGVGGDGASGAARRILSGQLLDSRFEDDIQYVVHQETADGRLLLSAVLWAVPGVPSPVEVLWTRDLTSMSWGGEQDSPEDGLSPGVDSPPFGRPVGLPPSESVLERPSAPYDLSLQHLAPYVVSPSGTDAPAEADAPPRSRLQPIVLTPRRR